MYTSSRSTSASARRVCTARSRTNCTQRRHFGRLSPNYWWKKPKKVSFNEISAKKPKKRISEAPMSKEQIRDAKLSARQVPPPKPYYQLSQVCLEGVDEVKDESSERGRSEAELTEYLSRLWNECEQKRRARPVPGNRLTTGVNRELADKPWKSLYRYENVKRTEVDQRAPFVQFLDFLEETEPEIHHDIVSLKDSRNFELRSKEDSRSEGNNNADSQQGDSVSVEVLSSMIDMSYLNLNVLKQNPDKDEDCRVRSDSDYPDWLWSIAPESRTYRINDLIQTPFENLSEIEKYKLFGSWRRTFNLANLLWHRSKLGRLGYTRPWYKDSWPEPLTVMDVPAWDRDSKERLFLEQKQERRKYKLEKRGQFDEDDVYAQPSRWRTDREAVRLKGRKQAYLISDLSNDSDRQQRHDEELALMRVYAQRLSSQGSEMDTLGSAMDRDLGELDPRNEWQMSQGVHRRKAIKEYRKQLRLMEDKKRGRRMESSDRLIESGENDGEGMLDGEEDELDEMSLEEELGREFGFVDELGREKQPLNLLEYYGMTDMSKTQLKVDYVDESDINVVHTSLDSNEQD